MICREELVPIGQKMALCWSLLVMSIQEIIGAEVCVGDENTVASLTNRLMMFIESTIIRSSRNYENMALSPSDNAL